MAKSLSERLASSRASNRVTIETLDALVIDLHNERERVSQQHAAESAKSIDFALGDEARQSAGKCADGLARDVTALAEAIQEMEAKADRKRESEKRRNIEAEQQAAIAERDELAERFKAEVPKHTASLIELFAAITANFQRMQKAGIQRPVDAENVARDLFGDLSGSYNRDTGTMSLVPRFDRMIIPNWHDEGEWENGRLRLRQWPPEW